MCSCGTVPLAERIAALRRVTEEILAPVGGAWRKNEVLYFAAPGEDGSNRQKWPAFFESLAGSGHVERSS